MIDSSRDTDRTRPSRHRCRRALAAVAAVAAAFTLGAVPPAAAQAPAGEAFGDWAVRCETPVNPDEKICYLFQNLKLKGSQKSFMQLAIGQAPGAPAPVAAITLPLGIFLPPGIKMQVDQRKPVWIPVQRCLANGCLIALPLDDRLSGDFKAGLVATFTIYENADRAVQVSASLKGFTAGMASLKSRK